VDWSSLVRVTWPGADLATVGHTQCQHAATVDCGQQTKRKSSNTKFARHLHMRATRPMMPVALLVHVWYLLKVTHTI
jgi:hypothetical protein